MKVLPGRVRILTKTREPLPVQKASSQCVLYWMSRDQRAEDNWALIYAQELATKSAVPVHVVFNLVPKFLAATLRQYSFMIDGLKETEKSLRALGIAFHLEMGDPVETVPALATKLNAIALVCDMSPLRVPMKWSKDVAKQVDRSRLPCFQVDAHNVVPVWMCSEKQEYAARTIRKKVHKGLVTYLGDFPPLRKQKEKLPPEVNWEEAWETLQIDRTIKSVDWIKPGTAAGLENLRGFCRDGRLQSFAKDRNNPNITHCASNLSPYTHFGQVSTQRAALIVNEYAKKHSKCAEGAKMFIEESVVRRELSENYCFYQPKYDSLEGASGWAQLTLKKHESDEREYIYSKAQFERGESHDDLWNAAQFQLVQEGKMHGFLRMYWAKKILEWSKTPDEALTTAIYLNDRYSLDGRDPNGYVGCMWSIAGVHDKGWGERPIFGKIRFMNYKGCKRKFKVAEFVARYSKQTGKKRKATQDTKTKKKKQKKLTSFFPKKS